MALAMDPTRIVLVFEAGFELLIYLHIFFSRVLPRLPSRNLLDLTLTCVLPIALVSTMSRFLRYIWTPLGWWTEWRVMFVLSFGRVSLVVLAQVLRTKSVLLSGQHMEPRYFLMIIPTITLTAPLWLGLAALFDEDSLVQAVVTVFTSGMLLFSFAVGFFADAIIMFIIQAVRSIKLYAIPIQIWLFAEGLFHCGAFALTMIDIRAVMLEDYMDVDVVEVDNIMNKFVPWRGLVDVILYWLVTEINYGVVKVLKKRQRRERDANRTPAQETNDNIPLEVIT